MRKFRVQFLDNDQRSSQENCETCIQELSFFMDITPHKSIEISFDTNMSFSNQMDSNQTIDSAMDNNVFTKNSNSIINNSRLSNENCLEFISLKELTQVYNH